MLELTGTKKNFTKGDVLKAKCFQLMGGWWKFMLTAYKCLQKFFFFKYYFKQVGLELILMESIKLLTHIYGLILIKKNFSKK